eukprot:s2006_g2.t1
MPTWMFRSPMNQCKIGSRNATALLVKRLWGVCKMLDVLTSKRKQGKATGSGQHKSELCMECLEILSDNYGNIQKLTCLIFKWARVFCQLPSK